MTFRLRAPNAKEVAVTGIGPRLPMTKDEQGLWSATTDTLKPDLYTYMFSVDGATITDPANGPPEAAATVGTSPYCPTATVSTPSHAARSASRGTPSP